MFEENDYIMRIIHELVRTLIKLIFGKDINFYDMEHIEISAETNQEYKELMAMIEADDINSAENMLLDKLDTRNKQQLLLALLFYQKLNEQSDTYLIQRSYSRQEILDGIKYVADSYGYGSIMEAFIEKDGIYR